MKMCMRLAITGLCGFAPLPAALAHEVNTEALYAAIAAVESDSGKASGNLYQVTWSWCADLERITGDKWPWPKVSKTPELARRGMSIYWAYYSSRWSRLSGEGASAELFAKLHRVGYKGLRTKRKTAEAYWVRVRRHYEKALEVKGTR